MARVRSASLQAVPDVLVDVDAPMLEKTFQDIVQDFNMIYDAVTGENSAYSVAPVLNQLQHNGEANAGSLLGFPMMQQMIGRTVDVYTSAQLTTYTENGFVVFAAFPCFIPQGETSIVVEVTGPEETGPLSVEVRDTANITIKNASLAFDADEFTHSARITLSVTGAHIFFFIYRKLTTSDLNLSADIAQITIAPMRKNDSTSSISPLTNSYDFRMLTKNVTTSPMYHEKIDSLMVASNNAIASVVVNRLATMQSAMSEYLTGAPVLGNNTLTQVDVPDTAPTTISQFKAHNRRGYANETLIKIPILSEAFGAISWDMSTNLSKILSNTVDPPTDGIALNWLPLMARTSNAPAGAAFPIQMHTIPVYLPDFPSTSLRCVILAYHDPGKGLMTDWRARVDGTGGPSAEFTFTQLGTTPFWYSSVTSIPFTPDAQNILRLMARKTTAFTADENMCYLGCTFYMDA